jgi:hypothetical protein
MRSERRGAEFCTSGWIFNAGDLGGLSSCRLMNPDTVVELSKVDSQYLRKQNGHEVSGAGALRSCVRRIHVHAAIGFAPLVLKNWLTHYNQGRPHPSIRPRITDTDPPAGLPVTLQEHRCHIPDHLKVVGHPVLGGLHHEYELVTKAA